MKCPQCQHENREGDKFCRECGTRLPSVCPHCGSEVSPQDRFCAECGARLSVGARHAVPVGDETVPKLEDMQKQLQSRIPQSLADRLFAGAKQMQGEYRLVTAVFADVSGSSGMAREMPLEQYVETMNDCFKMMVDTISIKYEGSINRFIGDCVLAFFGAPITHENDAERAILAALDIRDGAKELNLDVSIGINTGITYVGEMGSDLYFERSAWGPDVDFARRLQEAAGPGGVYVGAPTYRLTRKAFDFDRPVGIEAKESRSAASVSAQQIAYPVLRVREHPEKLRGIEGLRARMIGREREFADLKEAADSLISGRGSIVTIIGEAGLGKSRLALELKEYLRDKDVSWYEGRSISLGQSVSYWPFLDILRTCVNLSDGDTESEFAGKLRESIIDLFPQRWEDILPFLGNLLSIKFGDELDNKLTYFTPEQIRHQTLMRLRGVFVAISHRKPLLLILEDLHWSDDLSLDLVSLLMDDLAENPLMLLCIYRPERGHRSWQIGDVASRKCLERYTEITLKQLSAVQSRQLVESLLEIENLPEPTKDMILRKSEGNPFFIEEVIRSLIDRDLVYREDDRWKARREIEDIDVPDTIQSVLLSRVDRLEDEAKYVLQCASVIGRLFRYRLLDHLAQHERDLEAHLIQLEERDLVYEERTIPELEYAFKHALTQEATYQGILERRRREFHQRVADGIEHLYRERIEEFYGELAHHYKLGGNDKKAIDYSLKSGIKLMDQFANREALGYFNEAEKMIAKSGPECRKEKVILCKNRGEILRRMGQRVESLKDYEEALRQCDDPHDRAGLYSSIGYAMQDRRGGIEKWKLGLRELPDDDKSIQKVSLENSIIRAHGGGPEKADDLPRLHRLAEICQEMGYQRQLANTYLNIATWQSFMGDYSDEYSQKAIAIAKNSGDLPHLRHIHASLGGLMLWVRAGEDWTERSVPHFLKAVEIAERIGDIESQARELATLGDAYKRLGQYDRAVETWERALKIGSEIKEMTPLLAWVCRIMTIYAERGRDDMVISTYVRIMQAIALSETDEESQAMALLLPEAGSPSGCSAIYMPYIVLRDSYRIMGKKSKFDCIIRKTLMDLLRQVDSRPQMAWYHSVLMDLCLQMDDIDSAKSHAKEAISIVDRMGRPHYMTGLYSAYMLLNDTKTANDLAYIYLTQESHTMAFPNIVGNLIGGVELTYRRFGQVQAFEELCQRLEYRHGDELRKRGINQFHLESAEHPTIFPHMEIEDSFNWSGAEAPPTPWSWIDPEGISSYKIHRVPRRIEISSACGSAVRRGPSMLPRLSRPISGDFAVEIRMGGEKYGGVFIWRNGEGVTLQRWIWGGGPIALMNRNVPAGYGSLNADSLTLRLERKGRMFRAYCRGDDYQWYSCGWTEAEMEDPVQVGIFASCPEDVPQAVTSFDYVKIFRE